MFFWGKLLLYFFFSRFWDGIWDDSREFLVRLFCFNLVIVLGFFDDFVFKLIFGFSLIFEFFEVIICGDWVMLCFVGNFLFSFIGGVFVCFVLFLEDVNFGILFDILFIIIC